MQYKFASVGGEVKKVVIAWICFFGLLLLAAVLLLTGGAAGHGTGLGVAGIGAILYAGRLLGWIWETQKGTLWMTGHELRVSEEGLHVSGRGDSRLYPWNALRVEADGGPDLLVIDERVKVPVDALDYPSNFRQEARAASRGQLLV